MGSAGPCTLHGGPCWVAGHRRHAGHLFDVQRPAHVIAPRAVEAESRHANGDHVRAQRGQRFVVQPELLHHSRGEVLHDDVGLRSEPMGEVAAGRRAQVQRDVTLIQVGGLPQRTALVPVLALERLGARIAESVRPLDRLELDDVGAECAEVAGEVSARPKCGQVKHFQARERQRRIRDRIGRPSPRSVIASRPHRPGAVPDGRAPSVSSTGETAGPGVETTSPSRRRRRRIPAWRTADCPARHGRRRPAPPECAVPD